MKWVKLMRQVNMNSLVDDARETLTIAGLESQRTITGTTFTTSRSSNLGCLLQQCGSIFENDCGFNYCSTHATCQVEVSFAQCDVQPLWQDGTSQESVQTT